MTLFLFCIWLGWACAWMTLLAIAYGLIVGAVKLFRWVRARVISAREEQLANEFLLRVGMDDARRYRMIPEDTQ